MNNTIHTPPITDKNGTVMNVLIRMYNMVTNINIISIPCCCELRFIQSPYIY